MDLQSIVQRIAVYALPLILALTVREIVRGHVALYLGDTTGKQYDRLSLNPLNHIDPAGTLLLPLMMIVLSSAGGFSGFLIGWPKIIPIDYRRLRKPQRDIGLIAASGLGANLVMAVLWAILLRISFGFDTGEGTWAGIKAMATAGVFLNASFFVLNLLPLPPFDMGRVLVSVLPPRQADALLKLEPYSFVILLLLVITGIVQVLLLPPLSLLVTLVFALVGINGIGA